MTADARAMVVSRGHTSMTLSGVVGFFFSFRLIIVLLAVRVFQADPQVGVAASIVGDLLLFAAVAFQAFGAERANPTSVFKMQSFRWVLFFLGISFCSLLWTEAASLPAAIAYWFAMASDVGIVLLLLRTDTASTTSSALAAGYVIGACVIAVVAWCLPAQSDLRLGDEELLGPNQIGYACAFAVFLAQYLMSRGQGNWKLPAAFLAVTLLRSLSKTTIIAFIAGEALLLFRDTVISRKTKATLVVCSFITVAIFWGLIGAYFDIYSNAGNQSETLTGRIGLWAIILDKALEYPWFGHGFHSVWKVIPPFGPDQFEARHAHNELLQQFYAYGVVGILALVGLYRSFYLQIRRLVAGPTKTLLLGLMFFVLVRGLADTEAFDLSLPLWAITLLGMTFLQDEVRAEVPA